MTHKPVRYLLVVLAALAGATLATAQEFPIDGTDIALHVDAETLAQTPGWKPGENELPVSATQAISIASKYHDSLKRGGWAEHCSWTFFRAILITEADDRCFWIISYKGVMGKADPRPAGGYSYVGPAIRYTHYPVLMNGHVAPARPYLNRVGNKVLPIGGTEVQRAGWPQLSDKELESYPDYVDPYAELETGR